ncbi:GntR family transcriptional regulator [Pseudorhodoferax sp. Leaf274]|uniref:GntR family transcriptional regulator n=1 Tax=Pseudorhodoferax sp. Leaf274 TaxID=1736318 RepID=UPI00070335A4|nr:GntR family transcriptional regulator [Pseudorhodoferax sp. Leaf274]KQP36249.1 GntR family transcriptional regulator [Pseudorhodoferax sp. Leaf274]
MSAPSFKIEAPRSLATQVAQRLREAIVDGQFALGEMIPEEQLATSFGVSRTPVREALNQLQLLGLVAVKPQRGSYVFEATEADVEALCEFRSLIEPRAAELAFRHAREDTIAEIKAAVAEMAAARKSKDGVRYSRADTRLHEAFVLHCGNSYLQAAYATAGAKIAALRTHLSAPADVLRPAGYEQHQQLLAYFSDGDFAAFDALMRVHVSGTRESYVASLKARRAAAA